MLRWPIDKENNNIVIFIVVGATAKREYEYNGRTLYVGEFNWLHSLVFDIIIDKSRTSSASKVGWVRSQL